MQGFLYTVDPNQGKSGFATFIVHIYGTALKNLLFPLDMSHIFTFVAHNDLYSFMSRCLTLHASFFRAFTTL